jgi:putative endopeptidase
MIRIRFQRFAFALVAVSLFSTVAGAQAATPAAVSARAADTHGVLHQNFDRSVRPQDDFFRYVNGGWLRTAQIPDDRPGVGSFTDLSDQTQAVLRAIIEEATSDRGAPAGSERRKIGDLYASFMDTARVESLGITPLQGELARINALTDRSDLPVHFARLWWLGVSLPVSVNVSQDPRDATRYVALISQSGLGLPDRDYYLRDDERLAEQRAAYLSYLETLLRRAGDPDPSAGAGEVMVLERAMAELQWDRARSRDREATYNPRTTEQLDAASPAFSWSRFIGEMQLSASPIFVVRQPDYAIDALNELVGRTPLETWKRYMTVRLLDDYAERLSSDFRRARFEFNSRALQGISEERELWRRGVAFVDEAMGEALGKLYVERHFAPAAKQRMEALVSNLIEAFRQGIDALDWMTPETRAAAQAKLALFNVKIGYPDQWRDYTTLEVRADDLIGNDIRRTRFARQRLVDRLGGPIQRHEWSMTPHRVNAYYSSTMNEIVFPAGILQPPFFSMAADDAVNYGGIGGVIGHEISHGFDDQGSRSDGEGNLRNWRTPSDAAAFGQRTAALVAQYEALSPLPGMNVNGRLTLGENIGDLSGLAVAYKAYRLSLNDVEPPVIDGLTGDQRFFIGWAQVWRSLLRDEALQRRLLTDSHSPAEYRVNQVLRNLDAFHLAFATRPGDGMWLDPAQRVRIW